MATKSEQINQKAVSTGIKDGFLVVGFQALGLLVTYLVTLLPFLDTFQQGRYAWAKVPIGMALGAVLKAVDRKKHEDTSTSTGLVKI